jgi:nucleoid-associated protein YejK
MTKEKQITVLAAISQEALELQGADVETTHLDTIAKAKAAARYYITEAYMRNSECTQMLGYSQVVVDGKVIYDFFGPADMVAGPGRVL